MANNVHLVIHIADKTAEKADRVSDHLKSASGATTKIIKGAAYVQHAANGHGLERFIPPTSAVKGLRAIIINPRARAIFDVTIKGKALAARYAEKIGAFAAITHSLVSVYDESEAIMLSSDPDGIKASKMSVQLTSAALRVITGLLIVPEVTNTMHAISYATRFAAKHLPSQHDQLTNVAEFAEDYSRAVTTTFNTITDGNAIYYHVQTVVVPYWSNMMFPQQPASGMTTVSGPTPGIKIP